MKLSELLWRASELRAAEAKREQSWLERIMPRPFAMGKSRNGLVAIPNKIRKRMSGAER